MHRVTLIPGDVEAIERATVAAVSPEAQIMLGYGVATIAVRREGGVTLLHADAHRAAKIY